MERARSVKNRVLNELDNARVGNGGFFLGGDGRATMKGCLKKVVFGSQADWAGCVCHTEEKFQGVLGVDGD